ncbi:hypothetical protein GCM10007304_16860 [Rhodococcoides trifolii]|uniref:Uncharacterized protein n=1 Tax=Rhodococcoides trifolii TaxID=908250 RepID=A0A917FUA3_9NOCA|nr:hypothetical protein [Rhodococcus trifolii]GGG03389.1 hypothetical protein GCM10007304_16860 [Rhodococcus trifolii]
MTEDVLHRFGTDLALKNGSDALPVLITVVTAGVKQSELGVVDYHRSTQCLCKAVDERLDMVLRHD